MIKRRSEAQLKAQVAARQRRTRWQLRYRPSTVRLLLIAEAPPAATDRYFYFPSVTSHDALFRYVVRGLLGVEPNREDKPRYLNELKASGVYLIDVSQDPLDGALQPLVEKAVRRVAGLAPAHVILIKATVYDACYHALVENGQPVVNVRVPFPGSGQQQRFEQAFKLALRRVRWSRPSTSNRSLPDVYVSTGAPEPEIPGGCQIVAASTNKRCLNPGRHLVDQTVTCTTHRKAIERAKSRGPQ